MWRQCVDELVHTVVMLANGNIRSIKCKASVCCLSIHSILQILILTHRWQHMMQLAHVLANLYES